MGFVDTKVGNTAWHTSMNPSCPPSETVPPSSPQLLAPSDSWTAFSSRAINFARSGAVDTGAGISGYFYQVSTGAGFTDFFRSGFVSTTGVLLTGFTNGTYYRHVYAIDHVGNTGARSSGWHFVINSILDCASRWNNDNFITGAFRTAGTPTSGNVICALYGA